MKEIKNKKNLINKKIRNTQYGLIDYKKEDNF